MNWLLIVIFAHLLFAIAFIIDKFLLSKISLAPAAYAFYTGLLSIFVIFLAPFDFKWLSVQKVIFSFSAGALLTFGLLFMYKAFQADEVSRIAPIIGGAVPIFTLFLAFIFLNERLTKEQLIAFAMLTAGGVIMVKGRKALKKFSLLGLGEAFFAAFLMSSSFVLTKFIFTSQSFINGFIWIRLGGFLGACLLLIPSKSRQTIFKATKAIKVKTAGLVVFNKALGAFAFILLNFGVYLGSVTLVNSLQGVQYVFLLGLAVILSKKLPRIIKEEIDKEVIIQKLIAILLIIIGLIVLAI